ncbi:MAG: hypothetical protein HC897_15965 [Thermoanaerobaculia bacterium]|nr:hypothetical protein [Thermoanaerobaculia bacterium]
MNPTPQARELELQLPVGYVDGEGRLHSRVVIRKMTGREEAILADRRYQKNGGKLVTELLHSCLVKLGDLPQNGSSTVAKMYSADRNFLLLKLRSFTFGSDLEGRYVCPSCGETMHHTDNLDELPLRALPEVRAPTTWWSSSRTATSTATARCTPRCGCVCPPVKMKKSSRRRCGATPRWVKTPCWRGVSNRSATCPRIGSKRSVRASSPSSR